MVDVDKSSWKLMRVGEIYRVGGSRSVGVDRIGSWWKLIRVDWGKLIGVGAAFGSCRTDRSWWSFIRVDESWLADSSWWTS